MSAEVRNLEPATLWNHFADLNAVPRPSKKEERVIQFIVEFAKKLGLEHKVDHAGNVIVKKPASSGMEDRKTVVMQSHLDMVHQKNADTEFDFNTEGIRMLVEGDWVRAEGTTLGADNGIGVASIMTVLASDEIAHPPLEALFTIDEETGMTGALELKGGLLDADIMLNLDTEDDDELTIGCAGGIDVTGEGAYAQEAAPAGSKFFKVSLAGLTGGHSGMDINLGRANANKLMNRLLFHAMQDHGMRLASLDGGSLRNAIPRESFAVVAIPAKGEAEFLQFISDTHKIYLEEYRITDPEMELKAEALSSPSPVLSQDFQGKLLRAVYACPNGVYRMSPDIDGLVQTSNNVARILVKDGKYSLQCLTRSSVDTEKMDLASAIQSAFELVGAKVGMGNDYPGWTPRPEAKIVKIMSELYSDIFGKSAHVNACHAGLECGILGTNYPEMEMISFGPNIRGAHSPDEMVQISSVQKYWGFLLETLKRIPKQDNGS